MAGEREGRACVRWGGRLMWEAEPGNGEEAVGTSETAAGIGTAISSWKRRLTLLSTFAAVRLQLEGLAGRD